MSDAQQLLHSLFRAVRSAQADMNCVKNAVYAAAMKEMLSNLTEEFDFLESEILTFSARRGWELSEYTSISDAFSQARLRMSLFFGCTDSRIAELLINRYTHDANRCIKLRNNSCSSDGYVLTLFQKYTDCQRSGIFQLQTYL